MHMADTSKIPDRRKAPRFQVTLPVELLEGKGITRDLSACGVFFETDRLFVLGRSSSLPLSWNISIQDSRCVCDAVAMWCVSNDGTIPWEWRLPLRHTDLTRSHAVGWKHAVQRRNKLGSYHSPCLSIALQGMRLSR